MTNNNPLNIPELHFDANGELIISSTSASSKHDFDFFEANGNCLIKK